MKLVVSCLLVISLQIIVCFSADAASPVPTPAASAVLLPFASWIADRDAGISWDAMLGLAELRVGKDILVFYPGANWGILNGKEKVRIQTPSIGKEGFQTTVQSLKEFSAMFDQRDTSSGSVRKITTIFIDPGHGGKDGGAEGRIGQGKNLKTLREKDVVLKTSLKLQALLKKQYPDKRVILSRDTDIFLSLEERTRKANSYARSRDQSVLNISIHANASLNSRAKGYEVWYLPPEVRRQIVKPGDVKVEDSSVLPIINDIIQESITSQSVLLGQNILKGLDGSIGASTISRGIKSEQWYVVRNAFMPSVLIEVGFVTNSDEFVLLSEDAYLQKIADGIYSGMDLFIRDYERME